LLYFLAFSVSVRGSLVHFITCNETLRRTPLDKGSARLRKLYLLRPNNHKR